MELAEALALCDQACPLPVKAGQALKVLRMHLVAAQAVADGAARSDVECYAHTPSPRKYDLTRAQDDRDDCSPTQAQQIAIVQRAVEYIDLRGDALPYRLVRTGDFAWFEMRDTPKGQTNE